MENELKKCPFCGADAFMWRTNHYVYIQCEKYNAIERSGQHLVQVSGRTEEEAVRRWNNRGEPISASTVADYQEVLK